MKTSKHRENSLRAINSRLRYSVKYKYGQRTNDSLEKDVQMLLSNVSAEQNKPMPLYEEAIFMIKKEIKNLKSAKTRAQNNRRSYYSDWDQQNLEKAEALLPEVQKLHEANKAYLAMFEGVFGETPNAVYGNHESY